MQKEVLKDQIKNLKSSVDSKKRYIESANIIIFEKEKELVELEQEKSAAEEYAVNLGSYHGDWSGIYFDRKAIKHAHEAGQAHVHEVYKPLVKMINTFIDDVNEHVLNPGGVRNWKSSFRNQLKNLNQLLED